MLPQEKRLLALRPDKGIPAHVWSTLEYRPNPWSYWHCHTSAARYNAFATSRQVGKTTGLIYELFDALFAPPRKNDQTHIRDGEDLIVQRKPNVVGVISDTYDHAELSVMPFITHLTNLLGENSFMLNKNQHVVRMNPEHGSHELRWFSADNPRAGQGYTFSTVFIDEAQNVSDEFWVNLRPALGARMAQVFAFGTPDPVLDSTWFEGLFLRGLDEDATDYYAYSVPCTLNKWLPKADVQDALHTLSEREFRMKYLGQWVKHDGVVFKNPERCFTETWEGPAKGHKYSIGLDLAKHEDYTVAYVIDTVARFGEDGKPRKKVVKRMRFNHLDYVRVSEEVEKLYHEYKARRIRMDTTAMGEPVADMLRKKDLHVVGFTFGNKNKEALISTLAREIEHDRLILPKDDAQLLRELKAYTRVVTKAGNVQFTAPMNANDDCVIALALAVQEAQRSGMSRTTNYAWGA